MVVEKNGSTITLNLKLVHIVVTVVAATLTVMLTLGVLTNKYVDSRIVYHMTQQEKQTVRQLQEFELRQVARADARLAVETEQRKEQIRVLREDLVYIREKIDLIAMHLDEKVGK